ncbi:MAG: hypothetical protein J7527_08775 [Chitinophagaceae bacterium]|nr:hypothetical protein [Chitinophagaceae bacterium]
MLTKTDSRKLFDAILSAPGMADKIKLQGSANRKTLLLLHHVVERGLSQENDKNSGLLEGITEEEKQELTAFSQELLSKAGLTEMHDKLKNF